MSTVMVDIAKMNGPIIWLFIKPHQTLSFGCLFFYNLITSASGVQWYGRVLRRDNGDVLRRTLDFEVAERRGRGRPNMTWKRKVKEHINQIGLKREDAIDRVKWRNGDYELSRSTR